MTVTISAFRWVPDFAQGYVKDIRVRWALEEAGITYDVALVDPPVAREDPYRAWQPFGQVPAYRDETVELFESGAIVLHIAARTATLSPVDTAGRARVTTGLIAALNTVEPHVDNYVLLDIFHANEPWVEARRPQAEALMVARLTSLAAWLGDREHLDGEFSAADLMMASVLRGLDHWPLEERFASLAAYRDR
ncbi:MAG: glutathione S-transferase family protein, partial [Pseudomonadota bacterium]